MKLGIIYEEGFLKTSFSPEDAIAIKHVSAVHCATTSYINFEFFSFFFRELLFHLIFVCRRYPSRQTVSIFSFEMLNYFIGVLLSYFSNDRSTLYPRIVWEAVFIFYRNYPP